MKASQRVLKNGIFTLIANLLGGAIQLVALLWVANELSAEDNGRFVWLMAFSLIFQYLSDMGISTLLIREMSQNPEEKDKVMDNARGLFWFISVAAFICIALLALLFPISVQMYGLLLLMTGSSISILHCSRYTAVLRANEAMGINALGFFLHKVALIISYAIVIAMGWGLTGLVISTVVTSYALWLFYRWQVSSRYYKPLFKKDYRYWRYLIRSSIPLGGGMALRQFASQLDVMILSAVMPLAFMGLFGVPYRIILALIIIPMALALPLFPQLSKKAKDGLAEYRVMVNRSFRYFVILGVPLAVYLSAGSHVFIEWFLKEEFQDAIPMMRVLSGLMLPYFMMALLPFCFTAIGHQKSYFSVGAFAVICHVLFVSVGCFIGGGVAISASVLIADCLIVAFSMWRLGRLNVSLNYLDIFMRPLVAGFLMYLVCGYVWTSTDPASVVMGVVVGLAVYVFSLMLTGAVTPKDRELIRESLGVLRVGSAS